MKLTIILVLCLASYSEGASTDEDLLVSEFDGPATALESFNEPDAPEKRPQLSTSKINRLFSAPSVAESKKLKGRTLAASKKLSSKKLTHAQNQRQRVAASSGLRLMHMAASSLSQQSQKAKPANHHPAKQASAASKAPLSAPKTHSQLMRSLQPKRIFSALSEKSDSPETQQPFDETVSSMEEKQQLADMDDDVAQTMKYAMRYHSIDDQRQKSLAAALNKQLEEQEAAKQQARQKRKRRVPQEKTAPESQNKLRASDYSVLALHVAALPKAKTHILQSVFDKRRALQAAADAARKKAQAVMQDAETAAENFA